MRVALPGTAEQRSHVPTLCSLSPRRSACSLLGSCGGQRNLARLIQEDHHHLVDTRSSGLRCDGRGVPILPPEIYKVNGISLRVIYLEERPEVIVVVRFKIPIML